MTRKHMNDLFPRTKRRIRRSRDTLLILAIPALLIFLIVTALDSCGSYPPVQPPTPDYPATIAALQATIPTATPRPTSESPKLQPSPIHTDLLTMNLTWEEWSDLMDCVYATTTYISIATTSGRAYLDAASLKQAETTELRLYALADTLVEEAEAHPNPIRAPAHVARLLWKRTDAFWDLWTTLFQASDAAYAAETIRLYTQTYSCTLRPQ